MAKLRETPCIFYQAFHQCKKGREADHAHYCQHCDKYRPRAKIRHKNRKKDYLLKEKYLEKERRNNLHE